MSENNSSNPSFDGTRYTGRVKWFNYRAGFGFVKVFDGHQKEEVKRGWKVKYGSKNARENL